MTMTSEELENAQLALFFLCQNDIREDFDSCRSTFANIAPVIDERGIIRAEGRLGKLPLRHEVRHPIILPGNSPLVALYARRKHVRYLHQGYRVVLANIAKERVHIGNGKELMKSVASKRVYCRTRRESLLQQQMGILPAFRGEPCTPRFAAVAVDFFGPLQTKINRNTTTESSVMIVTCTTTRIVHLELTSTASTESFLLAWRRFVSRRCIHPTKVFSDRGTNFMGAQQSLRDWINSYSWDMSRVEVAMAANRTDFEWEFNVPKASHMNGVVESLIRSCRRGLDAAVNYLKRRFTFEEWQTFLSEVMYVVNSRPLFPDRRVTCNHRQRHSTPIRSADNPAARCRATPTSARRGEGAAPARPSLLGDVAEVHAATSHRPLEMVSSAAEPASRRLGAHGARDEGKRRPARSVGTRGRHKCSTRRGRLGAEGYRSNRQRQTLRAAHPQDVPDRYQ